MGKRGTRAAIIASALLLTACGGAEPNQQENRTAGASTAVAVARSEASPARPVPATETALTAEGFGPLRIGMTRAQVVAALSEDDDPEAVGGPDPESCDEFRPARAPRDMLVMIEEGRLTRISLIDESKVKTDRGLGLGATAAAVRSVYGAALRAELHKYEEAPAEYLVVWAKDPPKDEESPAPATARGILYEVGAKGVVQRISGGGAEHSLCGGVRLKSDRRGTSIRDGGDATRKRKLLDKQKEGKKRMRQDLIASGR
ncbi:MAG TPA: hypothetical protein VGB04_04540 [Allosphingosinicella sp.]|jgi:hypothetical protein